MTLLLKFLTMFSLILFAHSTEDHAFIDDLVGELTPIADFPPFLKSTAFTDDDFMLYPNNRQFRHLPGYEEFRKSLNVHSERSLQLQRFLGDFLTKDYERALHSELPIGTRIEDQKYEFKAMITSGRTLDPFYDVLIATEFKRINQSENERQAINDRRRKEKPKKIPQVRPRRTRGGRSLRASKASYADIPMLNEVEYPTEDIVRRLQTCEDEDTVDVMAATDFKVLDKRNKYFGFSIYRVTCAPVMDKRFISIGLHRILYEATKTIRNEEENARFQDDMIEHANALLRKHVHDNYFAPYIYKLRLYPTIPPFNALQPYRSPTEDTLMMLLTKKAKTATTTSSPDGKNDYDVENSSEDAAENGENNYMGDDGNAGSSVFASRSRHHSSQDTNRVPKRKKPEAIAYRNRRRINDEAEPTLQDMQDYDGIIDQMDKVVDDIINQTSNGNCRMEPHDVVIVMDESGSIGSSDFQLAKRFVANLTHMLRVGPGYYNSRVGLVKFSHSAQVAFKLKDHMSNIAVQNAITSLSYASGGTDIASGMNEAIDQVFTSAGGDRAWIPNMMIVMTDGQDSSDVIAAHARAVQKSINITAIGIGAGINAEQLAKVTGDVKQVFSVSDFASLLSKEFLDTLCTQFGAANGLEGFQIIKPMEFKSSHLVGMTDGSVVMIKEQN